MILLCEVISGDLVSQMIWTPGAYQDLIGCRRVFGVCVCVCGKRKLWFCGEADGVQPDTGVWLLRVSLFVFLPEL